MANNERTTCLVVGGGPAGLVLGLLMARAGVETTVLEKHGDFLRDFRGDTVHASTLTLLDELGLGERFAALPQRRMESVQVQLDQGFAKLGDMRRLPGAHQHIALVPQWDFLDLIADAAASEPTFTLLRNAEVVDLLHDGGRVAGVRYRDRTDGTEHRVRASLTVACDGRGSRVREAAGLVPRAFGVPMDVWWFRLPRHADDPEGGVGRVSAGHFMVMIDRGDYWQCAYLIGKGTDQQMRAEGLPGFRDRIARLVPWVADRVTDLESFDDVKLLNVELNRLRKWYADGLLLIGDAAHAMSPVGGVGINLAVADAVATARILAPALRSGGIVGIDRLRKVQLRRWWPTALIQGFQKLAHGVIFRVRSATPATDAHPAAEQGKVGMLDEVDHTTAGALPLPLRLATRFPVLQGIPARLVGIGPLPEHAPAWARRPSAPATRESTPQGS
ncbi:FAD-dependent oxidoreductase [Pseudonocardia lacus]|uniref:FAD-dependent oxidoreductase n=1 Tax=Pseudonocardia lacus TaxID=2835865 RepID=UPI001BDC4A89|nr:FAD-dependent oxidoreductase [Pseudonocardia lacus]